MIRKSITKYMTVIAFTAVLTLNLPGGTKFVKNTLKEINACEGKIKLILIRIWGDDEVDDENQFFRMPEDIKISGDNLVYIADSGNHRIQVFDRAANFKRTIGRKGKGPGDILTPRALAFDVENNLIVAEFGNSRIQAFDRQGKSLYIFNLTDGSPSDIAVTPDNEIAVQSYYDSFKTRKLISIYDTKGSIIRKTGWHYYREKTITKFSSVSIALNKSGNLFAAYRVIPLYQEYSSNGEELLLVHFEMSSGAPKIWINPANGEPALKGELKHLAVVSIAVDEGGRVYLITTTRQVKEKEKFFLVSDNIGTYRVVRKNKNVDSTDMFRLLVFNRAGKVIAAQKLNIFCDNLYIHEDRLFIVDTFMEQAIYEYKISFD